MTIIEPPEVGRMMLAGKILATNSGKGTGEAPTLHKIVGKVGKGKGGTYGLGRRFLLRISGAESDAGLLNDQLKNQPVLHGGKGFFMKNFRGFAVLGMQESQAGGFTVGRGDLQAGPITEIVIENQPRGGEKVARPKLNEGGAPAFEVLNAAGEQALPERRREALPPVEADPAVPVVQACPARAEGNAEAMEFRGKLVSLKMAALGDFRFLHVGQFRGGNGDLRMPSPLREARPVIIAPLDTLHGCFASKRTKAPTFLFKGTRAQVGKVPFARGQFDKGSMAGLLQGQLGIVRTREEGVFRMHLPRSLKTAGAREGSGVVPTGAALRADEKIPSTMAEEMRTFRNPKVSSRKEKPRLPKQASGAGIVFLDEKAIEPVFAEGIPSLAEQVLAPVLVMEKGRIKSACVEKDRLRPRPVDGGCANEKITRVFEPSFELLHIRVDEPKVAIVPAECRCPDAAATGNADEVEKAAAVKRARPQTPIAKIAAVVNAYARKPFKSTGG